MHILEISCLYVEINRFFGSQILTFCALLQFRKINMIVKLCNKADCTILKLYGLFQVTLLKIKDVRSAKVRPGSFSIKHDVFPQVTFTC